MEKEKTRLEKIKEQLENKLTRAIFEAIEGGAVVEKTTIGGVYIDGMFILPKMGEENYSVVMKINAPEIDELLKPSADELKERAEELRAELEEIENKLKSE